MAGMGPQRRIAVPDHLRKEADIILAKQVEEAAHKEEEKAAQDFGKFCDEHNVKYMPIVDIRIAGGTIHPIREDLAFVSNLRSQEGQA